MAEFSYDKDKDKILGDVAIDDESGKSGYRVYLAQYDGGAIKYGVESWYIKKDGQKFTKNASRIPVDMWTKIKEAVDKLMADVNF